MPLLVLGIDAGATKTVGYLADERERLLAESHAPGVNFQTSGPLAIETILRQVVQALVPSQLGGLSAVAVGMAGVDLGEEAREVQAALGRIGCTAPVVVVNDALIALRAGAGDKPGIVIISGTGSIVYGCNRAWQAARAGGWGHIIGDEGSGYWIGREALMAVVRAADGRGPATELTREVLAHFQIIDTAELRPIVYDRELPRMNVAALGPIVQRAVELADTAATTIVERAADELTLGAKSVAAHLEMDMVDCPIVLAGGVFGVVPALHEALSTRLTKLFNRCRVQRLEQEPALGAIRIALARASGQLRLPVYV